MTSTDQETEVTKRAVAKHYLLGADGQSIVEEESQAKGIRYVHIASGRTFDYMLKDGPSKDMLAIFGAKTLATNEASAMRQKEGDNSDQVGAIEERFALIDSGSWVDRTREGGVRIDKDLLTTAAVNVMVEAKAINEAQKGDVWAKLRQKLEDDPKQVAVFRQVAGVAAEYAKLAGKTARSVNELAALVA